SHLILTFLSFQFQSTPPAWGATIVAKADDRVFTFQSTPPAWGATLDTKKQLRKEIFQSTPPAWGATLLKSCCCYPIWISIHAPRMGGDLLHVPWPRSSGYFNPRPPHGGRLGRQIPPERATKISIHAPRMGGDDPKPSYLWESSPFQSTPPAWGATSSTWPLST
ncbi:hypothetical protein C816_03710, partial [Oscillibacter sp. 1-3]